MYFVFEYAASDGCRLLYFFFFWQVLIITLNQHEKQVFFVNIFGLKDVLMEWRPETTGADKRFQIDVKRNLIHSRVAGTQHTHSIHTNKLYDYLSYPNQQQ